MIEGSVRRAITDGQRFSQGGSGSFNNKPSRTKQRPSEDCRDAMRCSYAPESFGDGHGPDEDGDDDSMSGRHSLVSQPVSNSRGAQPHTPNRPKHVVASERPAVPAREPAPIARSSSMPSNDDLTARAKNASDRSSFGDGEKPPLRPARRSDGGRGSVVKKAVALPAPAAPLTEEQKAQQEKRQHQENLMRKFHDEIFGASAVNQAPERTGNVLYDIFHSRQLVVDPQSWGRFAWDIFLMVLTIFISFELPYRLAFEEVTTDAFKVYDYFVDSVFFLDIALNFRTGYILDGETIYDPVAIGKRYLTSWFTIDFISTMQWELIVCSGTTCSDESSQDVARSLSLLRVSKVSRLLRLLRLTRLYRYLEKWEGASIFLSSNTLRVFKLISLMVIFAHWDGCLHYLVAVLEGMPEGAWPRRANIYHEVTAYQYLVSLFNAVSQMLSIGYGIVPPQRMSEVFMVLFSMILGATLYGLFVASLTSFLADSDASAKQYNSRLDMLNQYMKHRQLPAMLRVKMRRYLELCFPNKRAFNENEILYSLTLPLRQQVCWHKCAKILEKMPLHEALEPGLMGAMSLALHRVVYVQGDYILREGEIGKDMYFVAAGEVQVVTGPPDRHVEVTRLREGAFFGEMALLDNAERHMASVRVVTFCDGFCMSRQAYQALVKDYPSVKEYLESVAKLRLAASLEASVDAVQETGQQVPDFADQDLRSLVNTAKTSGYAMAPIHQGLDNRKAKEDKPFSWLKGCFSGGFSSSVRDLNNPDGEGRNSRCSLRKGSLILESARRTSCLSWLGDRRSSTKSNKSTSGVNSAQAQQAAANRRASIAASANARRVSVAPAEKRRSSVVPGRRASGASRRSSSVAPDPQELAHANALATLALCGYRVSAGDTAVSGDDAIDNAIAEEPSFNLGKTLDGDLSEDSFGNSPTIDGGAGGSFGAQLHTIMSCRQSVEEEESGAPARVDAPNPEKE